MNIAHVIVILSTFQISIIFEASSLPDDEARKVASEAKFSKSKRIVGGNAANIKDYPSVGSMIRKSCKVDFCGGAVIVNSLWAITTASVLEQCFEPNDIKEKKMFIRSNSSNWKQGYSEHLVTKSYVHQKYVTYDYDIAVLKVKQKFSKKFEKPAQLVKPSYFYKTGSTVTVLGWGWISDEVYGVQEELQKVDVKIENINICKQLYAGLEINITQRMVCALDDGKDACVWDIGGPLYQNKKLIGLVSFASPGTCANQYFPGVYVRLSKFTAWIKSKISPGKRTRIRRRRHF